jgi:hypothetical protein
MRACFKLCSLVAIGLTLLAQPLRAEFVYVINLESNNVSAYRIGKNGALTPVVGSPFPTGSGPVSVAVDRLPVRLRGKRGPQQCVGLRHR